MHEMGIIRKLISIVAEQAASRSVACITLEIGTLAAIQPDAIRFCFDASQRGTALAGATLEIDIVAADATCNTCGHEFKVSGFQELCAACGSASLIRLGGDEIKIREIAFQADAPLEQKEAG